MMRRALNWVLDLLYPPRCMVCDRLIVRAQAPVCQACLDTLPEYDGADVPVEFAERCVATFFYRDALRESILRFKFGGRDFYADMFGRWMAVTVRDKLQGQFDCITWAPVSRKRLRERGYDQAELLCRALAKELGLRPVRLLEKVRHTRRQSGIHDEAIRRANASGAYQVCDQAKVLGQRVLLVDDIVTTGATLAECCRVLRTAGAQTVVCAALAAAKREDET